jgi:hypothetical protein
MGPPADMRQESELEGGGAPRPARGAEAAVAAPALRPALGGDLDPPATTELSSTRPPRGGSNGGQFAGGGESAQTVVRGHFRVQWIEDGRTWDATGVTLPSLDGFLALLDGLEILTPEVWTARAPAGLADAIIAADPDSAVGWNANEGIRTIWSDPEG